MIIDRAELARQLADITEEAGRLILDIYNSEFETRSKDDSSPVTDADEKAEALILERLAALGTGIPVVAEEAVAAGEVPDIAGGRFFLVDPLDGTKEFINRNGEFTVNIALIEQSEPVAGAVHLPALGQTYWGAWPGAAWRRAVGGEPEPITVRPADHDGFVVVASRSHRDQATDDYLKDVPVLELVSAGSSLKLCRVAEGQADMYPRLGRTMEWDIAAGHAVLMAAGGKIQVIAGGDVPGDVGQPLRYGKPGFENPYFVARGG
ncbi:3'(2'),5'-bisphosphate nucleotidase CysQ [Minwuia thermotolerans]|uniref:3'(2'),5'-bisphosphate nucleotidase CysQ n=1 Tax=Minwuia thermotolerans TaxID=2056226 RepID=A0A2M9G689_9PROT|nr:3'(2'),5'-bisphosphate nucleotidase CysQ [Minwuia thermotolerans]PJK31235.1 3'(2'),5'-bisphosphate nucleotidase [Minwuia thermotolerans]